MTTTIDLFSYLPGLEVTSDEILESELLAYQILKAKFPTLDLREGTGLRDLVLRPNATLLALVNKALVFYFSQNTISGVVDDTPQVFVDKLMSNWFLNRKQGIKAVINARLYFAKSKPVTLSTDIFFSTDGTLKFFPTLSASYSADQLVFDPGSNQYYLDVDLTAERAGKTYNITSGSLIYFTNFDPYLMHAEINYLSQTADDIETNTEFISRAKTAISTRNLINVPSITSNLLQAFTAIEGVYPVGMGDVEMIRDKIKVLIPSLPNDPVWIHNGGCTDAYCRVPLESSVIQLTSDSNGLVNITGAVYKVERSFVSGGASPDTMPLLQYKGIYSVTSSGLTATVSTTEDHGYYTGQRVFIAGATQLGYNGWKVITVTGLTTFTFTLSSTQETPATGTITCGVEYPFIVSNVNHVTVSVSGITQTGGVATVTCNKHGLNIGERVELIGANQPGYTGIFKVVSIPTRDTFTVLVGSALVSPATGTLTLKMVDRYNDVGFSNRQHLQANFGNSNGDKTVSLILYYFQDLDGIQSYLENPANRVVCNDTLSRGFNISLLDLVITGYDGVAPDASQAETIIKTYLASLVPGQSFIMADLLSLLYASGIKTIKTPLGVTYTKYWRDLLGTTSGTIVDVLNPQDSTNIFLLNSVTTNVETI